MFPIGSANLLVQDFWVNCYRSGSQPEELNERITQAVRFRYSWRDQTGSYKQRLGPARRHPRALGQTPHHPFFSWLKRKRRPPATPLPVLARPPHQVGLRRLSTRFLTWFRTPARAPRVRPDPHGVGRYDFPEQGRCRLGGRQAVGLYRRWRCNQRNVPARARTQRSSGRMSIDIAQIAVRARAAVASPARVDSIQHLTEPRAIAAGARCSPTQRDRVAG